jgi:hypothetical protein
MSALLVASYVLQGWGTVLVFASLYGRHPWQSAVQAWRRMTAARTQGRLRWVVSRVPGARMFFPARSIGAIGSVLDTITVNAEGRAKVPQPRPLEEGASDRARIEWLEGALDLTISELRRERAGRLEGETQLRRRLDTAEEKQQADREDLLDRIRAVAVPDTAELLGAAFLLVALLAALGHTLLAN